MTKSDFSYELNWKANKHKDLAMFYIDKDLSSRLRMLIYSLNELKGIWNFPPKNIVENFSGHFKYYEEFLTQIHLSGYVINAHIAAGMMELVEDLIELNIEFMKDQYKEKLLAYQDEASNIYVCVKMFELNKITAY